MAFFIDQREIWKLFLERWNPREPLTKLFYKDPASHCTTHWAVVTDNKDPDKRGWVKVKFPQWGDTIETHWIPVVRPFTGPDTGMFMLPEVDEIVLCGFINAKLSNPVVLGTLRSTSTPAPVNDNKDNPIKGFFTKGGNKLVFNDKDGEESITIETAEGKMGVVLSKSGGIRLFNDNGDIKVKCKKLTFESKGNFQLKSKKDIKITSDTGSIKFKANRDIKIAAGKDAVLKANTKIKLKGMTTAGGKAVAKKDDQVVGVDIHQVDVPAGNTIIPTPLPHPYVGKLTDDCSTNVELDNRGVATKGTKSKHLDPGHIQTPPGIKFTSGTPSGNGEITLLTVPTVKVNNKEIATLGSMVKTCNFPTDLETCTVVAIGASVVLPIMMPCCDPEQFKRDGGFPINTRNLIAPADAPEFKNRQMTSVQWEKSSAKVGEEVKIEAKFVDHTDGAEVVFKIWEDGADKEKETPVAEILSFHEGGKAEAKWRYVYVHNPENPLTEKPKFKVEAWSFKCGNKETSTLEIASDLKISFLYKNRMPFKNLELLFIGPDSKKEEISTNDDGKIEKSSLIPGYILITFKKQSEEKKSMPINIALEHTKDNKYTGQISILDLYNSGILIPTGKEVEIILETKQFRFSR